MLEIASSRQAMNYSEDVIQLMRKFYHSLSEKDRRRYAAVEATKIGYGGISYIAKVLGCSRDTIKVGQDQLENMSVDDLTLSGIRRHGAGRKRALESMVGLEEAFRTIMARHQVQNGRDAKLSQRKIVVLLESEGYKVSTTVIRQLLQKYQGVSFIS